MRIDVQLISNLALVDYVPSFWDRLLRRRNLGERYAVYRGGIWCFDDTGRLVDANTRSAIDDAMRRSA